MKWYKHDPSAALAGMIGLTVEERGAYYTLIDLQYARAPHGDVTDHLVIKALAVRPQVWRRLKAILIAKGKVHETGGKLTANRVQTEVISARKLMDNMAVLNASRNENNNLAAKSPRKNMRKTTTTTREEGGKTPQKGFSPLLQQQVPPLPLEGKEKENIPARSLAALPTGALTREPDSEPAERKRSADKKPAEMTLAEINARWRANGGFG